MGEGMGEGCRASRLTPQPEPMQPAGPRRASASAPAPTRLLLLERRVRLHVRSSNVRRSQQGQQAVQPHGGLGHALPHYLCEPGNQRRDLGRELERDREASGAVGTALDEAGAVGRPCLASPFRCRAAQRACRRAGRLGGARSHQSSKQEAKRGPLHGPTFEPRGSRPKAAKLLLPSTLSWACKHAVAPTWPRASSLPRRAATSARRCPRRSASFSCAAEHAERAQRGTAQHHLHHSHTRFTPAHSASFHTSQSELGG